MANTKEFNISSNAVTVLNQTAEATNNAKKELRELQKQMLEMDVNSAEFAKAAARAGELKDQMNDAADAVRGNTGPAIEALNNSFSLMRGQLANLDFEGLSQSLNLVSTNLRRLKPEDISKGLKSMADAGVQAFKALGRAILANPILAVAAIVVGIAMNFERIVKHFPVMENALFGIDQKQREIAKNAQLQADASKNAYQYALMQENAMRLQGKSEKEILEFKMKGLETSIKNGKINLEIQEQQAKAQIDAAVRNQQILQQIIRGALEVGAAGLRLLTAPIEAVLATANKVSETLGFGKITATSINEEITKLTEAGSKLGSELIINPAEQEQKLKESFDKQRNEIAQMESDYAGFQLSIIRIDKDAADKAAKAAEDAAEKARKELEDAKKLYKEKRDAEIAAEDAKYKALQEIQESAKEKEITTAVEASEALYNLAGEDAAAQILITEDLKKKIAEINKKYADEEFAKEKEARDKQNEANAIAAAKELAELQKAEQAKAQLRIDAMKTSLSIIGDLAQAFAGESEAQQRKAFQIQKGVSIATATIDTYLAAQGAYRSQMAISTPDAPVRASVAAGIAIAQGLARVAVISKQQFNGTSSASSGNNGGSLPSASGGTQAPSPANFAFLGMQPQQQPPLQAYVLSGQVSSNLEAQQLINNQARLGG